MKIGIFEAVIIVAVLLTVVYVWRWLGEGRSGVDEGYEDEDEESSAPSGSPPLRVAGLMFVLGGLGLLIASYVIIMGLASMFIWATAILLLGIALLLLSRQ
ncbi:hypothetical protein ABFB09_08260 [Dehalogenimonas sp. THU2]|uniref:hypothetical protein n=1 Tax=Dehalogenimonas sp. THU2 TaxID=3151121 RepID=UPI003218D5C8